MKLPKNRIILFSEIIFFFLSSIFFISGCSNETGHKKPAVAKINFPETFTFFDLGSNTVLSETVVNELSKQLGSYAIEKMTTLDISLSDKIFFKKNFPDLYKLNIKLNDEKGARVEHNITNLIFRYPRNEYTPFDNVKLVFSNYTNKPLFIYVTSGKKEGDIAEILTQKYGKPLISKFDDEQSKSLTWEINNDFLIFSSISKGGSFKYSVMICFVNNIKYLLKVEENEIKKREEKRKKAGRTAF